MRKLFTLLILLFLWTAGMTQQNAVTSISNVAPQNVTMTASNPVPGGVNFIHPNSEGKSPVAVRPVAAKKENKNVSNPTTGTPNPLAPMQGGETIALAFNISSLPFNEVGTTAGYTDNYNEVCPYTSTGGKDVVYKYTPAANGVIDITLCGDITEYDTKLYVYDIATPVTGDAIACNDDYCSNAITDYISEISGLAVTGGVTYYIVVDGYSSVDYGTYEISVSNATVYPVPVNDDCSGATVVSGIFPQTVTGTTLGATVDCPGLLDWNAVWYAITLPYTTNNLTVNWCGTANMATVGVVYYNTCPVVCGSYNLYTSNVWSACGTPAGATTALTTFLGIPGPTTIYYPAYSIPQMDHVITFDVINATVTCAPPTLLTATNFTNTSADLSWTAGASETNWNVEVGPTGFAVGTGAYVFRNSGPENPLTATPLDPGTQYQYYVQADCGGDLSTWVGPYSFYTTCDLVCPSGSVPESEACGTDLNGGCNMPVPAFETVVADEIVCGTTWASGGTRDTDWFSLTLDSPAQVILHANSEAQIVFAQLDYGTGVAGAPVCPAAGFISSGVAGPCAPGTLNLGTLVAGTHWFFVGANGFEGLPCSIDYWIEFEVNPPAIGCGNINLGLLTPTTTSQAAAYASGDTYYWTFDATAGVPYTFSNCGAGEDTYLRIYDNTLAVVASNDDYGIHCSETAASLDFTPVTSGSYYVSLAHYSCNPLVNAGNLYYYYTACPAPTALNVTGISTTGASLGWTSLAGAWEYQVGATGFVPAATGIATTNNPTVIGGLIAATSYDFYVRANCGGGSYSDWAGPFTFATSVCEAVDQCNYTFRMTDAYGDGWNGNSMAIRQSGVTIQTISLASGSGPVDVLVGLCHGIDFELFWNAGGSWSAEVGIEILDPFGASVYYKAPGTGSQNTLLYTGTTNCTPPAFKTLNLTGVFLEGLYAGGGLLNEAYNETAPQFPGYADEITVELHNGADYTIIEHTAVVLLSLTGTATVDDIPVALNGDYYITVKHRNSVETTTADAVSFALDIVTQSFATPADVYGGNLLLMLDGGYAIYGGDVNHDGAVDGGDVTPFDNDQFNYVSGYVDTDINGDAIIDSGDGTIIDNNQFNYIGSAHP